MRVWKTGLAQRYVAPMLFENKDGGFTVGMPSSIRSCCNQINSVEVVDMVWYSTFVDDLAVVDYFLEDHEMAFGPK